MRVILTIFFSIMSFIGSAQSIEQIAFDSFIKDNYERLSEFKFHGETTKYYSGSFVDYSTCFKDQEYMLDLLAVELNKLNHDKIHIEYSKKDFSKKSQCYLLKIYKATPLDDKFMIRIEAIKGNHILEFYYLLDSDYKVLENCSRNIIAD